ncbi:large ATP-binding protein [Streptomyces sp. NPDC048324]|uniref:large ATP-binding protein n=1 Tax=Streptomyces sp. NPDC048324 TaxID=3157205 RepID=UPI00341CFC83
MNPHDTAKRPGTHLVAEEFGVEDPWALSDDHPPRDPLHLLGRMVAEAACDVDELHGELTRAAQSAIELLEPFGRGDSAGLRGWDGILRTAGPQIDLLAARRSAAFEQLNQAVSTYHRLLPESDAEQASKAPRQNPDLAPEQAPGRDDDWAIAGGRQLGALEAVEAGGLRFHQSTAYGYIYLSDGRGQRPNPEVWPETVRRLVADGLLDQDTSEGLYRPGQLLSLTPQGEAALRDARTATPRVSAALSRSNTAAISDVVSDSAVTPATSAATKPSRTH